MGRKTKNETIGGLEVTVTEHPADAQYELLRKLQKAEGGTPPIELVREIFRYTTVVETLENGKKAKYELAKPVDFGRAFDGRGGVLVKALEFAIGVNSADFTPPAPSPSAEDAEDAGAPSSTST